MTTNPLRAIRNLDYVILFARDMVAMRQFYEAVLLLPIYRELSPQWIEYRVGSVLLTLTERGLMFDDPSPTAGTLSAQLAFRVAPDEVEACAAALEQAGVTLAMPVTDRPWGHRTAHFRDPDGNVIEIYADID